MSIRTSDRWNAAIAVTAIVASGAVFGAFGSGGGEPPSLIDPVDEVGTTAPYADSPVVATDTEAPAR